MKVGPSGFQRKPIKKSNSQHMMEILRGKYPQLQSVPVPVRKFGATLISLGQLVSVVLPARALVEMKEGRSVSIFCVRHGFNKDDVRTFQIEDRGSDKRFGCARYGIKIGNMVAPLALNDPCILGQLSVDTQGIKGELGAGFPSLGFAVTNLDNNKLLVESVSDKALTGILYCLHSQTKIKGDILSLANKGAAQIRQIFEEDRWQAVAREMNVLIQANLQASAPVDNAGSDDPVMKEIRSVSEQTRDAYHLKDAPMLTKGFLIPLYVSMNAEILGCRVEDTLGQEYYEVQMAFVPGSALQYFEADTPFSVNYELPPTIKEIVNIAVIQYSLTFGDEARA